jgi:general stress protein 26
MERSELIVKIRNVLWQQLYAVLATVEKPGIHTTIVSFAAADDLHSIVFPTPTATRKYQNLKRDRAVSLFIDDRMNDVAALKQICGIEVRGQAFEIEGAERDRYEQIYSARNPDLAGFVRNSALFRIDVERYDIVMGFQNVFVLQMQDSGGSK